jgi:hypothetical protein
MFVQHNHPDVNRSQIPWKESDSFKRLQSISQSIKSLEYGRRLHRLDRDLWILVDTTQGPRKPEPYNRGKVSGEDIIVLPDSKPNEFIDLNVLYSEQDSSEIRSFRGGSSKSETAAEITKSETVTNKKLKKSKTAAAYVILHQNETAMPYTVVDKNKLSLLLDSGCIGRDFISSKCVNKSKLNTYPIMYPIEVNSIYGKEIATEVVQIH